MHRKIFYFLLILSLFPALLQAGTKGRIKGKVVDLQTGDALIGANVIVMGTSSGAATDANGDFLLQNLEAGVYTVRASYLGYQTITISNVRVNGDLTSYIDFELPSEDIQVGTVEIVAQKPLIQKDNTNAVRITTSEDIEALPVRGINNIISLTAGVIYDNDNIYIRGGRNDEVGYYLEGVSIRNPLSGARGVSIAQDAIEEIQVQSGGYTAEFGNANSGIIRQSFKSGGAQLKASLEYITDNLSFKSKEDAFDGKKTLGAYQWGYNEISGVLSGPLFDQRIKFFTNVNYQYYRDPDANFYSGLNMGVYGDPVTGDTVNLVMPAGPRKKNQEQSYIFTGTLNIDLKPVLLRISGNYTMNQEDAIRASSNNDYIQNMLNNRVGLTERNNGTVSLKLTHVLSPTMFYELSAGYYFQSGETFDRYLAKDPWIYGDSVANAAAGFTFTRNAPDRRLNNYGQYKIPQPYKIMIWDFYQDGTVPVSYSKTNYDGLSFNGNLSILLGKYHSLKIGGEYQTYALRQWSTPYSASRNLAGYLDTYMKDPSKAGISLDQAKQDVLINYGVNNIGYDVLGNEYDGDGFYAPRKPVFASAYIQDKIEYEDLIINAGLRFDYIDTDNMQLIDPTDPSKGISKNTKALIPEGWEKVPTFSAISPRLGFSFPVTDKTVFHAQYGKFIQQPALNDSYWGYHTYSYLLIQGNFFGNSFTGPNLRPTRTTNYEIGFNQQLTDFLAFDITGYYRDVKDQVVFVAQPADERTGFQDYYIKTNGDFATTKGVELTLTMRRYERLALNGSLSFQDARGTGSFPGSNRGIVGSPLVPGQPYVPKYISPLDFNRDLTANLNIDYRFGDNDGPAFLHNFGVSVLLQYASGRPFTRGEGDPDQIGDTQPNSGDARTRRAIEPLNTSIMPSTFQVDLRIEKSFNIFDRLNANFYIFVVNLFDTKNVQNVFLATGSADDNGYVTNPTYIADKKLLYGDSFADLYRSMNITNADFLYDAPRQIRFGIRLEY